MKLRDYQELIIDEVQTKFKDKNQLVVTLGMGGGKSVIISEIARIYSQQQKNVVILTNISELIPQLAEHLEKLNLKYNVIKSGYETKMDPETHIYLVMEQSFHEEKRKEFGLDNYLLIKDEFHIGKGGKRYEDIKDFLNPQKVLGLTGTPYNENGFLMEGVEPEELILHGSSNELTSKGWLVPLKYYVPHWSQKIDYSQIEMSGSDYSTTGLDKKINTTNHSNLIVTSMNEMDSKNKKTLVYCNSISHSQKIFEELQKDGYKVGIVHSENSKEDNEDIIKRFSFDKNDKNSIDCIVSVSKLTTGFNQPQAQLLVLCRPTKILRLYLQIVFRVARLNQDKEFAQILDLAQCVSEHGFGTDERVIIKSKKFDYQENKKEKILKELKSNSIQDITKDDKQPTEINIDNLNLKMKEVRIKNVDIKNSKTKDLMTSFRNSIDLELIVGIGYEIYFRMNKTPYDKTEMYMTIESLKEETEDFTSTQMNKFLSELKNKIQKSIKEKKELSILNTI